MSLGEGPNVACARKRAASLSLAGPPATPSKLSLKLPSGQWLRPCADAATASDATIAARPARIPLPIAMIALPPDLAPAHDGRTLARSKRAQHDVCRIRARDFHDFSRDGARRRAAPGDFFAGGGA